MPLFLFAATASTLFPPPVADAADSHPPLTAATPDRDAGTVAEDEPLTAAFTVINRSAGAVSVGAVEAGCSCQTARGLPQELAAGASAELKVTLKTRGRAGRQRGWWAVNYTAADGEEGRLLLTLTATVSAAGKLEPTPPVAQFGAAELGEPVEAAVVLAERTPGGEDVTVRGVDGPDWLTIKLQKAAGDGPPRYRLALTGTPPATPGRAGGAVRVRTDHPRYGVVEVPWEAFVRGRADVTPRSLVQIVGGPRPRPAATTVRGRNGAAVTAVTAVLLDEDGGGGPAPLPDGAVARDGDAWQVTVPNAPAEGPRTARGTLRLTVSTETPAGAAAGGGEETHDLTLLTLRPAAAEVAAAGD